MLDAYEAFYSVGEAMPLASFHNQDVTQPVQVTGTFIDLTPEDIGKVSAKWLHQHPNYPEFHSCVRVRWTWRAPDARGEKSAFSPTDGDFTPGGVGGFDSIITSCLPVPLRISPTDAPEAIETQVRELLTEAVKAAVKSKDTRIAEIASEMQRLSAEFHKEVQSSVDEVCGKIGEAIDDVFGGYKFGLEPEAGKFDAEKVIGGGSYVRVTSPNGSHAPLSRQGTGLRRAFLWSALAALAELGRLKMGKGAAKKTMGADRTRILLIDEPEAFLHPPAVRAARDTLYQLAATPGWQVLASTHSPIVVDVSKNHTTIVRVDRHADLGVRRFSTDSAGFTSSDRDNLRMVRSCHPTTNEFFFADTVVLVEGDTEQAVLQWLIDRTPGMARGIHVVNCMGKGLIPLFARILNQFKTPYVVLHDSDSPRANRKSNWVRNAMWTENQLILDTVLSRDGNLPPSVVIAHVPDFEGYYFGTSAEVDKPYQAITRLETADFDADPSMQRLRSLLEHISSGTHPTKYASTSEFETLVRGWIASSSPTPAEQWLL